MQVVLEIDEVRKSFSGRPVLNGISFSIGRGQQIALLGPNGAGKTTLIRCICGLSRIDSGQLRILGNPLPRRGGREALGVVPQEIALYEDLSAEENLRVFGRFHGLRGRKLRRQMDWALQWTGLADVRRSRVGTFSGGMKRRINIACGVLHEPEIVLLDEPTVGVDPQSRQRIYEMLAAIRDTGTSILLTTHHLDEAESQCDSIVIMDHGTVVAQGNVDELIHSTVGPQRRLRLRLAEAPRQLIPGLRIDETHGLWIAELNNVAEELPAFVQRVQSAGATIRDLQVEEPRLHHVFLHLTGRELRDG